MALQTINYEIQIQDTTIPDGCCGAVPGKYSKDTIRRIL